MLVIGTGQYDSLLQADPKQFVAHALRSVAEAMPDELRGIPPHLAWSMAEVAIARARGQGLTTDKDILGFVHVMFEIAPNFDQEPTLRTVLSDTKLTPSQRWQALFAGTPEIDAAWERAAHPEFYDERAWFGPALEKS